MISGLMCVKDYLGLYKQELEYCECTSVIPAKQCPHGSVCDVKVKSLKYFQCKTLVESDGDVIICRCGIFAICR